MFTRLDSERNAKIMKRAVNDQKLDPDQYKVSYFPLFNLMELPPLLFNLMELPSLLFNVMELSPLQNAKIMKRAVNNQKLEPDQYRVSYFPLLFNVMELSPFVV